MAATAVEKGTPVRNGRFLHRIFKNGDLCSVSRALVANDLSRSQPKMPVGSLAEVTEVWSVRCVKSLERKERGKDTRAGIPKNPWESQ